MDSDRVKHLEFLQAVISRLASNSFVLKGWAVTLVAALFALAQLDESRALIWFAAMPILTFWGLDAYYLRRERAFRLLFDAVRRPHRDGETPVEDFSMDTTPFESSTPGFWCAAVSCSVAPLYGALVLVLCAVQLLPKFM